jgi:hypothetical protein
MSQRQAIQDATGIALVKGPNDIVMIVSTKTGPRFSTSTGNPVNGSAGFITGCIAINPFGTPGNIMFVNQGTNISASWFGIA